MTQSPLEPLILRLAVPAIISNLVTVTYNMADTWFIGRLGTSQSGAVGVAFSVMVSAPRNPVLSAWPSR